MKSVILFIDFFKRKFAFFFFLFIKTGLLVYEISDSLSLLLNEDCSSAKSVILFHYQTRTVYV